MKLSERRIVRHVFCYFLKNRFFSVLIFLSQAVNGFSMAESFANLLYSLRSTGASTFRHLPMISMTRPSAVLHVGASWPILHIANSSRQEIINHLACPCQRKASIRNSCMEGKGNPLLSRKPFKPSAR